MLDPNSTLPHAREARVTMRGVRLTPDGSPVQVSTRSDFIAPDVAPVSTLALELSKGERDWTDFDVKVAMPVNGGVIVGKAERELAQLTAGTTVIRKTSRPDTRRVLNVQGPAHRRVF